MRDAGSNAPSGRTHDEPDLDQERLNDILDRASLLAERRAYRLDSYRAARQLLRDRREVRAIERIEPGQIESTPRCSKVAAAPRSIILSTTFSAKSRARRRGPFC